VAGRFARDGTLVRVHGHVKTFDEAWKTVLKLYEEDKNLAGK
jgi:hypothetical protein